MGGQRSPRDAPGEKPVDLNVALVARDQDLRALLGSYLARAHETPFRLVASGSSLRAALDAPIPCDAIVIAGASGPAITSARVAAADRPDLAIVLLVDACTAAVEAEAVAAGAADILDLEDLDVDRLERAVRLAVARGRRATSRP